jgi:hypothetical protein
MLAGCHLQLASRPSRVWLPARRFQTSTSSIIRLIVLFPKREEKLATKVNDKPSEAKVRPTAEGQFHDQGDNVEKKYY